MVILVVGAGHPDNMGHAIAQSFDMGNNVMVTDADLRIPTGTESGFRHVWPMDVTDYVSICKVMETIHMVYGRLDAIVNCAGVNLLGAVDDYPEQCWDKTIDVNLKGTFLLVKAYVNYFSHQAGTKHYVVIGSNTAYVAKTRTFAYGASKAGLTHLIRCLARELAPRKFALTSLDIGAVEGTPMDQKTRADLVAQRGGTPESWNELLTRNIPWGRMATAREVADWVKFIIEKGEFATGCNIRVDGGQQQG